MERLFQQISSPRLSGFFVWCPMLEDDNEQAAREQARRVHDPRIQRLWDPYRELGARVARTLSVPRPVAWDVYLAYAGGLAWTLDDPPMPTLWMHQLDAADPSRRLNEGTFLEGVRELLNRQG